MRKDFLVFGRPAIEEPEIAEVVATLRSGWIGTGPRVRGSRDVPRVHRRAHAVALNSCTAALHLSMVASGVGPGDEVVTTPMTFCATANAIVHTGRRRCSRTATARPVTSTPPPSRRAITPRTRRSCRCTSPGVRVAWIGSGDRATHRLLVIEDAAHAIEASTRAARSGRSAISPASASMSRRTSHRRRRDGDDDDADSRARIKVTGLHGMSADAWNRFSDKGYRHYEVWCRASSTT